MKAAMTLVQDLAQGDQVVSGDGQVWDVNAMWLDSNRCFVVALVREENKMRYYDSLLLSPHSSVCKVLSE
jgi:hypothetical protein